MQVGFGDNPSYQLAQPCDAIAISWSEEPNSLTKKPSWKLDVYAATPAGRLYVGTINTIAQQTGLPASARVIAHAACPGARAWAIEATGPADDVDGGLGGRAYAELKAHKGCCPGFVAGVYRAAARTIYNGAIQTAFGADSTAPLANSRTDFAQASVLGGAFGSNETAATGWIMFFDANALPANGAQPVHGLSFHCAAGASFSFTAPQNGIFLAVGMTWALSTTPDTLTVNTAAVGARVTTLAPW